MPKEWPNTAYEPDDMRHWLTSYELRLLAASRCADLYVVVSVSVKLDEYQERGKRQPKRLTAEQTERESAASRMLDDRHRASSCQTLVEALRQIAWGRSRVATLEAAMVEAGVTVPQEPT